MAATLPPRMQSSQMDTVLALDESPFYTQFDLRGMEAVLVVGLVSDAKLVWYHYANYAVT